MKKNVKWFVLLHILLAIYSMGSVFSKLAAQEQVGSVKFFILYGCVVTTLGIFAIGWQQIIKYLPLTTAYMNKAATVVWGMFFGRLVFQERFTIQHFIGVVIIIVGIMLFIFADKGGSS